MVDLGLCECRRVRLSTLDSGWLTLNGGWSTLDGGQSMMVCLGHCDSAYMWSTCSYCTLMQNMK